VSGGQRREGGRKREGRGIKQEDVPRREHCSEACPSIGSSSSIGRMGMSPLSARRSGLARGTEARRVAALVDVIHGCRSTCIAVYLRTDGRRQRPEDSVWWGSRSRAYTGVPGFPSLHWVARSSGRGLRDEIDMACFCSGKMVAHRRMGSGSSIFLMSPLTASE
jgi:hypothetical protein